MNVTQRQSILDAIVEFEKADFNTPFQNKYKPTAAPHRHMRTTRTSLAFDLVFFLFFIKIHLREVWCGNTKHIAYLGY